MSRQLEFRVLQSSITGAWDVMSRDRNASRADAGWSLMTVARSATEIGEAILGEIAPTSRSHLKKIDFDLCEAKWWEPRAGFSTASPVHCEFLGDTHHCARPADHDGDHGCECGWAAAAICVRCGRGTADGDLWDPEAGTGDVYCSRCWKIRDLRGVAAP